MSSNQCDNNNQEESNRSVHCERFEEYDWTELEDGQRRYDALSILTDGYLSKAPGMQRFFLDHF